MAEPRYPHITVQLTKVDGNAFMLLGATRKALRLGDVPQEEISRFSEEATKGDYDALLQTIMKWVNVE